MTAAENLARWREALDAGARSRGFTGCRVCDPPITDAEWHAIRRAKREAMPALLAFAEAVLRWADDHVEGYVKVDEVDRLVEQHLGGAR